MQVCTSLQTDNHASTTPLKVFYRPDSALPAAQPTASKPSVLLPSVLLRCWLGGRKGIRPVKTEWWVLAWLSVWSEVQTCIWPSLCHCHSLSPASVKSRLVLPFWYWLTRVVPEKGPLNECMYVCMLHTFVYLSAAGVLPTTTTQLATAAGSPNNTAIATDTSTTSISTRPTPSGRSKVFCYCFGSAWIHFGFI